MKRMKQERKSERKVKTIIRKSDNILLFIKESLNKLRVIKESMNKKFPNLNVYFLNNRHDHISHLIQRRQVAPKMEEQNRNRQL